VNANPVVDILYVNLHEDHGPIETIHELINQKQRVAVLHCDDIKSAVVNTQLQLAI